MLSTKNKNALKITYSKSGIINFLINIIGAFLSDSLIMNQIVLACSKIDNTCFPCEIDDKSFESLTQFVHQRIYNAFILRSPVDMCV